MMKEVDFLILPALDDASFSVETRKAATDQKCLAAHKAVP